MESESYIDLMNDSMQLFDLVNHIDLANHRYMSPVEISINKVIAGLVNQIIELRIMVRSMDKEIRNIEKKIKKDTKGEEKSLKKLEKADKKRDKVCDVGEKVMKKKAKK